MPETVGSSLLQRRHRSLPSLVSLSKPSGSIFPGTAQQNSPVGLCNNKSLGAYDVLEKLAEGTAGVVYRAESLRDRQQVAVKYVRTDDEELLENARQEYAILQSLQHPYIIKALDFINIPTGTALVMDYFPGCNLKTAVRKSPSKHFAESTAQLMFSKLVEAVAYLHRCGIVHRDIKAENVLVATKSQELRLIDFNVAGRVNGGMMTVTGTVSYMPPEVAFGDAPSAPGDIWAVGLCLYLMLCGKLPLENTSFTSRYAYGQELSSMRLATKLASSTSEYISNECKEVLQSCLMADPETRATAHELFACAWTQTPLEGSYVSAICAA